MEYGGFLPPEPPGPEPELGPGEKQPPPPSPQPQQSWPQPAQWTWQPAPPPPPPPPPPQTWPPPAYGQPAWGYPVAPPVPGNGAAVAGFILSLSAAALLLFTAGFSSIVSVVCAIFGVVYSRRGRERVDAGKTPKHRSLATAGFVIGIVSLIVSVIATLLWGAIVIGLAIDAQFRNDFFENDSSSLRGLFAALLTHL